MFLHGHTTPPHLGRLTVFLLSSRVSDFYRRMWASLSQIRHFGVAKSCMSLCWVSQLVASSLASHTPISSHVQSGDAFCHLLQFERLQQSRTMHRVTCSLTLLHVTLQGFMVGSDGGTLFLFERDGEGAARTYRKTKTLALQGQPVKIRNLAVSPTEDTLLCTLENNQMYSLNLTNTELMKASLLCCAVLCCAVLCLVVHHSTPCCAACFAMLCCAVLCITLCRAVHHALPCCALHHALPCCAVHHALPCCAVQLASCMPQYCAHACHTDVKFDIAASIMAGHIDSC